GTQHSDGAAKPTTGQDGRTVATAKTFSPVLSPADTTHTVELSRNGAEPSDIHTAEPPPSKSGR
ncbi:MAG: hypothetical protein M3143_06880, partial [Actinomycetota bacterium]|nr:hypothetical protein [Actinomycetota bacterium]